MKLREVYKLLLSEILDFDKIYIPNYQKLSNDKFEFVYDSGGLSLSGIVLFQDIDVEDWNIPNHIINNRFDIKNVSFTINDSDDQSLITNQKVLISILAVIKKCVDEYIASNDPDILLFVSVSRTGELKVDTSKDSIYKLLMRKYLPSGYGVSDCEFTPTNMKGFCVFKK